MKLLILGMGFLGTRLYEDFSKEYEVYGATKNPKEEEIYKIDATSLNELELLFEKIKPEIVINTIALTSSVKCEKDPMLAEELNFKTTKNILKISKKFKSKVFFISSSYLFDGKKGNYTEMDGTNSKLEYSKSKLKAERELINYPSSVILRVDLMYGYNGVGNPNSFLENIINESEIFVGNYKQIRSPVYTRDVSNAIKKIIEKNKSGIFNLAGNEKLTMLDFFKELSRGLNKNLKITILDEKDLLVKPLKDSSLNNSKAKSIGITFNSMKDAILDIKSLID